MFFCSSLRNLSSICDQRIAQSGTGVVMTIKANQGTNVARQMRWLTFLWLPKEASQAFGKTGRRL